jgi:hypothetical protein
MSSPLVSSSYIGGTTIAVTEGAGLRRPKDEAAIVEPDREYLARGAEVEGGRVAAVDA